MQDNNESKKKRMEKLRKILDDIPTEELTTEDEKYLQSLKNRLEESNKDIALKRSIRSDDSEQDINRMKPKVRVYPRKEEKVIEFTEVTKEEIEKPEDVEFESIEEKKELKIEDEDIFEVKKVEVIGPEFIQVKPKETEKEEKVKEIEEEKVPVEEDLSEWEPVEAKEEKVEEIIIARDEISVFCVNCNAKLREQAKFCPECGHKVSDEIKEIKEPEPEIEKEEVSEPEDVKESFEEDSFEIEPVKSEEKAAPAFIPVKPVEKEEKKEIEEKSEWEPVEIEETKKEETIIIEPVSVEEEIEITEEQIEAEEDLIKREEKVKVFKELESIDEDTAVLLYDNGFTSTDSLNEATVKDLTSIKGIKRKVAKNIKKEIEKKILEAAKVKPIETDETIEPEESKIIEEKIEEEPVVEEAVEEPSPVELSAESAEWGPAVEEELEEVKEPGIDNEIKTDIFKDIKSINDKTAILLYDNGFTSVESLATASIKDLTKIKGIKKNTAKKIKKELEQQAEQEWEPLEIEEEEFIEDETEGIDEKIVEYVPLKPDEEYFVEEDAEDIPPIEESADDPFKGIPSIDTKIAGVLKENGIKTIAELEKLTIKDLTKIRGIKKKTAKQIKKELKDISEAPIIDETKMEYDDEESPYIKEIDEEEDEWESYDEDKVSDLEIEEIKGFRHGDYTLYEKEIENKSGKKQKVRFFSKGEPEEAKPIDLPKGYEVKENVKTKVPYLKKKK